MTTLLCTIFFLSGASALIFETLWFRQAGLVFGNGVWASSLVLASFMLGLAIGNGVAARYGARIVWPVRLYAGLEALIALTGVLLVFALPSLVPLLAPLLAPLSEIPWAANLVRLTLGFALLTVPATAMGATLPILVKALLARDESFGSALGRLYGWNTLGAVVGAVAGEAVLLEWFGVRGSAIVAGSLNLLVAAVALVLSSRFASAGEVPASPAAAPSASTRTSTSPSTSTSTRASGRARRLLAAGFFSGFALLALEVVWFRFLLLYLQGTSLVFSAMLGVVLSGIALGALVSGRVLRSRPQADRLAPVLSLASSLSVVVLYGVFALLPEREQHIAGWLDTLAYAIPLMLLPSFLSGAAFTCLASALAREVAPPTRAAGWMILWNTLGSGAGSLAGGFLLLPLLGIERSFFLVACVYLLVAWLALPAAVSIGARAPRRPLLVAAAMGLAALAWFPFGLMESRLLERSVGRYLAGNRSVAAVKEGRTETIVLLKGDFLGQPVDPVLLTNGHPMSSISRLSRRYMKLYVVLPNAFAPEPRQALLISYGVGNTARALVDTPSLERIDVVDISREILAMSSLIHSEPGSNPLDSPRVHVHIEDGRYFLQTTERRYDLITSEPPPPKNAQVVNLYTREYFQLSRDRLSDDGIHTYWLPIHGLSPADARSIVRAYCDVFEDCSLWNGTSADWMLVGSRGRDWQVTDAAFGAAWRDPDRLPALREIGLEHPEQLLATFMADADQLRDFVADAKPLVDDYPKRLADHLPQRGATWSTLSSWVDVANAQRRFQQSDFVRQAFSPELRARALPWFEAQRILNEHAAVSFRLQPDRPENRIPHLAWLHQQTDLETLPLWLLGLDPQRVAIANGVPAFQRGDSDVLYQLARVALARQDFDEAIRLLRRLAGRGVNDARSLDLQLYALCASGRTQEAAGFERVARDRPVAERSSGAWRWARESACLAPAIEAQPEGIPHSESNAIHAGGEREGRTRTHPRR